MKKIIVIFLILFSKGIYSCECASLVPISKELSENYNVIFRGTVDSVSACDNSKERAIAYFTITNLFKGAVEQHVKINFDCSSECLMSFAAADEWIIYAKYTKFDYLNISICEHSRKKPTEGEQDLYLLDAKRTFAEELDFLKTTLGIQSFIEANTSNKEQTGMGPRNEQPSGWGKVTLLLISFVVMAIVYFVTRKKK